MANKNNIDTLDELFNIWQNNVGAKSAKEFLQKTGLSALITTSDLQKLAEGRACFSPETVMSVYGLLPVKLKLTKISLNVFPQYFYRLNHRASKQPNVTVINISLSRSEAIFKQYSLPKLKLVKDNANKFRHENQNAKNPEKVKEARQRYLERLSPEQKALLKEKSKLRMRKYRAEHPESCIQNVKKAKERRANLSEIEKISRRIDERLRKRKYREEHKEEIAARRKQYRESLDPNVVREKNRLYNQSENRKKSLKTYYENHKQELALKAKNNPMTKIYKQRYKAKKRFQERTGTTILSLLQALAEAKSR